MVVRRRGGTIRSVSKRFVSSVEFDVVNVVDVEGSAHALT